MNGLKKGEGGKFCSRAETSFSNTDPARAGATLSCNRCCRLGWVSQVALAAVLLVTVPPARIASADIYQWEWIDPNNHSLGRQQSTTLSPDGAGRDAVPLADLRKLNLTMAWLHSTDLYRASFYQTTLTDADLSQANLTNAYFTDATLTDADFTGVEIRGASFYSTTDSGFTAAQLYSTASYLAGDLSGIVLGGST